MKVGQKRIGGVHPAPSSTRLKLQGFITVGITTQTIGSLSIGDNGGFLNQAWVTQQPNGNRGQWGP